jgi:hypothetical protein
MRFETRMVPRIPFLLEYSKDDADEGRRGIPRENPKALCRCGAEYSQFIVNPKWLASFSDGQREHFLITCVQVKSAVCWPSQCEKCAGRLLGRKSA